MKKAYTTPVIHNEDLTVIDVMTASLEDGVVDNSFVDNGELFG